MIENTQKKGTLTELHCILDLTELGIRTLKPIDESSKYDVVADLGKGKFIHTMAKEHPEINFIGIEKYSSVLLRAIQKMEQNELPNLRFIRMDAEDITEVFEKGEVDKIFLNFSDPWPKDRHAKRRLPSKEFLKRYDEILKKDGVIEFKTDNRDLFDFAVEQLEPAGWKAEVITYDLHHDPVLCEGNIMTEYEEKFSSIGNPICKYVIYR